MKNRIVFILFVIVALFVSCASVPSPGFDVNIIDGKVDGVEIKASPIWLGDKLSFATARYKPGIGLFLVDFNNTSNELIKVLWEESSITYNNSSYTPFLAGQKYADAGNPAAPTIIPKNTSISKEVYSSGQVKYSDGQYGIGWYTTRIDAPNTILIFCIEQAGIKKYITINVKTKIVDTANTTK